MGLIAIVVQFLRGDTPVEIPAFLVIYSVILLPPSFLSQQYLSGRTCVAHCAFDVEQQRLHLSRPSSFARVDDVVQLPQNMRIAQTVRGEMRVLRQAGLLVRCFELSG